MINMKYYRKFSRFSSLTTFGFNMKAFPSSVVNVTRDVGIGAGLGLAAAALSNASATSREARKLPQTLRNSSTNLSEEDLDILDRQNSRLSYRNAAISGALGLGAVSLLGNAYKNYRR